MRRTNGVQVTVNGPTVGLITRVPSNLPDKKYGRAITVASNVRAERGVLSCAPGYEKVVSTPGNLDSPVNLIFESNITNISEDVRNTPIIGTSSKLYALNRRARTLACDSSACRLTVGLVGDSHEGGDNQLAVATLVDAWTPDLFIHLGDMVYASAVRHVPDLAVYEEAVGQFYKRYIGGYNGFYGVGPVDNRFFPVLGNHDWSDADIHQYYDFFNLPGNERYYSIRRGPVEFFFFSGDETEPDGTASGSIQGLWLQAALAASDCPWRFVILHPPLWSSDDLHYPGRADLRWIADLSGVSALISGHAHDMEVIETPSKPPQLNCGVGGGELRTFHSPLADNSTFRHAGDFGALRLDVNSETATFGFYTVASATVPIHTVVLTHPNASSGICYVGDAANEPLSLAVRPGHATVEVGSQYSFSAWATLRDGNVVDVTRQAFWTSSNDGIGSVAIRSGLATGRSKGTATITASFEAMTATGSLRVLETCIDAPLDILAVVNRSASMDAQASPETRLQAVKEGLLLLGNALNSQDRLGLISFSGNQATQTENATLDCPLDGSRSTFANSVSLLVGAGNSGIASGLNIALTEFTRTSRVGARKIVLLITDWPADVTTGGSFASEAASIVTGMAAAVVSAGALTTAGAIIAVLGYDIPAAYLAQVKGLSSEGYYFGVITPDEAKQSIEGLPYNFCLFGDFYYYSLPDSSADVSPRLDYKHFINWDIPDGVVDLCGMGSNGHALFDLHPGHGLYVDLAGTDPWNADGSRIWEGAMRTKVAFAFTSGKNYKLSLKLGGNRRQNLTGFRVHITFGTLVDEVVTIDDWQQALTVYSWTFTPGSTGTAKITIQELTGPHARFSTVGIYLDDVKLENLTDSVIVFSDNFDLENPV